MFNLDVLKNAIQHPILIGFFASVFEKLTPETKEKLAVLAAQKITEYVSKNS